MKKIILLFIIIMSFTSCKNNLVSDKNSNENISVDFLKNIKQIKNTLENDNINIGDTIEFGSYVTNIIDICADTYRPIKWEVLDTNDEGILLISKAIIDAIKISDDTDEYNYSNVNEYINNILYEKIFSPYEKSLLKDLSIFRNGDNDKISILSQDEIKLYFDNENITDEDTYLTYIDAKKAIATSYVKSRGVSVVEDVNKINFLCGGYLVTDNNKLKLYNYNYEIVDIETDSNIAYGIRPVIAVSKEAFLLNKKIKFGKYEQDNDDSNGKEDIIWKILYKFDDKYLLQSEKILDVLNYQDTNSENEIDNEEKIYLTYENSNVRKFLINDFYDKAFNDKEKNILSNYEFKTLNINKSNNLGEYEYDTLEDKIFLLDTNEINHIIETNRVDQLNSSIVNTKLSAVATKYALSKKNEVEKININKTNKKKDNNRYNFFGFNRVYSDEDDYFMDDEEYDDDYFDDYYYDNYNNYLTKNEALIGDDVEGIGLNNISPYLLRNVNDEKINFCNIVNNFPPEISLTNFNYSQSGIRPCIVLDENLIDKIIDENNADFIDDEQKDVFYENYLFNKENNVIKNKINNKQRNETLIKTVKYNSSNFNSALSYDIERKIKSDDKLKKELESLDINTENINIISDYYNFDFKNKIGRVIIYNNSYIYRNFNCYLIKFDFELGLKDNLPFLEKFNFIDIIKLTDEFGFDITDEYFDDMLINADIFNISTSLINTHMNSYSIIPMKKEIYDKFKDAEIFGVLQDKDYYFAVKNNFFDKQYDIDKFNFDVEENEEETWYVNDLVDVLKEETVDRYLIRIKFNRLLPEIEGIDINNVSYGNREAFYMDDLEVKKITSFDNIYDIEDLLISCNMRPFKEILSYDK